MPVMNGFPLSINAAQMRHRPSVAVSGRRQAEIADLLASLVAEANESLLEPAMAYERYAIKEIRPDGLLLANGVPLSGPLLPRSWAGAEAIIAAVGTIGPRLEARVTQYFTLGDPLKAYLLDDIGNLAVDRLSAEFCRRQPWPGASSPLSPGLEGWPVTDQALLYELSGAAKIGIRLTEGDMLVPGKSVSLALGLGENMPHWTEEEACARCSLRQTCLYRTQGKKAPHG